MSLRLLAGRCAGVEARVNVPPSKSLTNRALLAAAVAGGGLVHNPLDCDDTRRLATALATAGWELEWRTSIEVGSRTTPPSPVRLDLGDSGTGARFVIALLAAVPGSATVDGSRRLRERPMQPLLAALVELGAVLESARGFLPVRITGARLEGGSARISPGASSQFVSALLLVAPCLRAGLDLELAGPVPSRPYLDLTEDVLRCFGGDVARDLEGRRWRVGPQPLRRAAYSVEGDWSAAAFFLGAAAVAGGSVELTPLSLDSRQGDRALCAILSGAGMVISGAQDRVRATGPVVRPITADLRDAPDLFPALAVVAACAPAGSRLSGLDNLRHKESDRLTSMVDNLRRLGAGLEVERDSVIVTRPLDRGSRSSEVKVGAAGDHRIAMAMAVAALAAGPLELDDGGCVQKSFPGFWQAWSGVAR